LLLVLAKSFVLDFTVDQGEQGVIGTDADVRTRMNLGSTLADQDIACCSGLPVAFLAPRRLDSESRPLRVLPTPFL